MGDSCKSERHLILPSCRIRQLSCDLDGITQSSSHLFWVHVISREVCVIRPPTRFFSCLPSFTLCHTHFFVHGWQSVQYSIFQASGTVLGVTHRRLRLPNDVTVAHIYSAPIHFPSVLVLGGVCADYNPFTCSFCPSEFWHISLLAQYFIP